MGTKQEPRAADWSEIQLIKCSGGGECCRESPKLEILATIESLKNPGSLYLLLAIWGLRSRVRGWDGVFELEFRCLHAPSLQTSGWRQRAFCFIALRALSILFDKSTIQAEPGLIVSSFLRDTTEKHCLLAPSSAEKSKQVLRVQLWVILIFVLYVDS